MEEKIDEIAVQLGETRLFSAETEALLDEVMGMIQADPMLLGLYLEGKAKQSIVTNVCFGSKDAQETQVYGPLNPTRETTVKKKTRGKRKTKEKMAYDAALSDMDEVVKDIERERLL